MAEQAFIGVVQDMSDAIGSVHPATIHWVTAAAFILQARAVSV